MTCPLLFLRKCQQQGDWLYLSLPSKRATSINQPALWSLPHPPTPRSPQDYFSSLLEIEQANGRIHSVTWARRVVVQPATHTGVGGQSVARARWPLSLPNAQWECSEQKSRVQSGISLFRERPLFCAEGSHLSFHLSTDTPRRTVLLPKPGCHLSCHATAFSRLPFPPSPDNASEEPFGLASWSAPWNGPVACPETGLSSCRTASRHHHSPSAPLFRLPSLSDLPAGVGGMRSLPPHALRPSQPAPLSPRDINAHLKLGARCSVAALL